MKFDFTDGEWSIWDFNNCGIKIQDNKQNIIASVNNRNNARLISCAPEMLMALIEITKALCNNCPHKINNVCPKEKCYHVRQNISIIEKATGKKWEEIINDK